MSGTDVLADRRGTPAHHRPPRRLGAAVVLLLLALLPALAGLGPAQAPAAAQPDFTAEQRAAAIVRPAVVYLEIEWEGWVRDKRDGQLWDTESVYFVNRCTGFGVSPDGYIVTAGHCVDPGPEGVAPLFYEAIAQRLVDGGVITAEEFGDAVTVIAENSEIEGLAAGDPATRNVYVQHGVAVSGLNTGEAFSARVIDASPLSSGDVALLKVDEELPVAQTADAEVAVGTPILAIGYPGSADDVSDATLEPSSKDGKISNLRTEGGVPFYETSAAMTGGMSGGPVVDLDGQVIGLVSSSPSGETQAFNFAAASPLILEMLERNGVANELGGTDQRYREGLEHYFAGRYGDAVESFDAVLVQDPSHQQAQEYRQLAAQQQDSEGGESGISGWVVALAAAGIGLVVVAGVAVLAVLLVVRGRRRTTRTGGYAPPNGATAATAPGANGAPTAPAGVPPPPSWPPPAPAAGPAAQPAPEGPGAAAQPVAGQRSTATAAPQPEAAPETRYCGNCGATLGAGARFCAGCGTPVT